MSNLPTVVKDKLNIWQKLRIRVYLLRKYSYSRFEKSPDYIKQDKRVLRGMIKGEQAISVSRNANLLELFINNSTLFDEQSRKQIIEYAITERKYEVISHLNEEEQYQIIITNKNEYQELLKFANINTVRRLIDEEIEFGFGRNIGFNDEYKADFIKYCNPNVQIELIKQHKELMELASTEVQVKCLKQDDTYFELATLEAQNEFLKGNIEYLKLHLEYINKVSKENQLLYASQKKENLKYIEEEYQIELLEKHPSAFKYASPRVREYIFKSDKFEYEYRKKPFKIINYLLNCDMKYFKYIGYDKDRKIVEEYLSSLKENINNLEDDKIKEIFIKSGILSAKGNLRRNSSAQLEGYGERVDGLDIYSEEQLAVIQGLNIKQISELIKVDANYIMPYVKCDKKEVSEIYENKEKCKQVFIEIYGEEKFKELESCIDKIFEAQINFQNNDLSHMDSLERRGKSDYRIPLESLKLLFTQEIVKSNSSELIKQYYNELFSNENERESFNKIILKAYGEEAIDILDSRKELDVYAINSLEIFNSRILENFDKEFVHDLLSYNIRDFSSFLNIIKNENELELFKEYYGMLSEIMGKNVETMQKAIGEFYYNKGLLENIKDAELSEKQYINLISVVCGEKNQFNISTIEQLENFNETANEELKEKLNNGFDIKDTVFTNIFGIDKSFIDKLVDIYDFEMGKNIMSDEERELMNCINFIFHESDKQKIMQLTKELISKQGIRNPIVLYSGISKIKERGIEFLRNRLLTKDKLDKICEQENKEIRKETIDGVEVYYFEGLSLKDRKLGFLEHSAKFTVSRDFMEAEGQDGMSTVSARLLMDENALINSARSKTAPDYFFSKIESEDLLAYDNEDANIHHSPKLVTSSSVKLKTYGEGKIRDELKVGVNEVAFYRRTRNHTKRKEEKLDGRIKPDFLVIIDEEKSNGSIEDIPEERLEYAKKYNIPIIVFKVEKYREKRENERISKINEVER